MVTDSMINGEVIAHVAIDSPTLSPAPVLTTRLPDAVPPSRRGRGVQSVLVLGEPSARMSMINSTITAIEQQRPSLLAKPQPLGFLPTRWFWRDPGTARLAGWLLGPIAAIAVFAVTVVGPHPIVAGVSVAVVLTISQGLLEKYVRRQVMKRRALAESAGHKAIGP